MAWKTFPVLQAPETAENEEPAKEEPKAEARCGWEIMLWRLNFAWMKQMVVAALIVYSK